MSEARQVCLADSRGRRTTLLCLLYFCQGFPWGFATIALLATLSQAGHGKAETATVVALAILPWTFKFVFGPLIDSVRMPSLGVRRPWIAIAQFFMALTLLSAATSGAMDSDATVTYLAWVFFVHNCFAALQDVATDSLAVDLLDDNERGRVNGFMWGSKLLGIAFGGAGMATVIAHTDLKTAVLIQAGITLAVLGLVIVWRERAGERRFPWSAGSAQGVAAVSDFGVMITARELVRAMSNRTTATLALVAATYAIAEGLYDPLTVEFFVQDLGWTADRFARAQGTWGVLAELCGAILGGYLGDRLGRRRIAALGLAIVMLVLLSFGLTAQSWHTPDYMHILLLPAFKGTMAFTTVSLFSLFMKVSWTRAAATQFTLYMAMGNVGYAFGAKLNTWLEAAGLTLTMADFYLVAGSLPLIAMVMLVGLDPDGVEARKLQENRQLAMAAAS